MPTRPRPSGAARRTARRAPRIAAAAVLLVACAAALPRAARDSTPTTADRPMTTPDAAAPATPDAAHEFPPVSPEHDRRVDYVEFPATDVAASRRFYADVFGWKFTDYGPDYTSFEDGRLAGGFRKVDAVVRGGPLVVIFALDLADAERRVRAAGGTVVVETHSFPGGRRFHFTDPSGNELAVWSDR